MVGSCVAVLQGERLAAQICSREPMQRALLTRLKQCNYSDYQLLPDDWTKRIDDDQAIAANIDNLAASLPILLEGIGTFNVVQYAGRYIGVPLALGPIDLRQHDPETLLGVLIADSLEEVRRLVSHAQRPVRRTAADSEL